MGVQKVLLFSKYILLNTSLSHTHILPNDPPNSQKEHNGTIYVRLDIDIQLYQIMCLLSSKIFMY